jgi:hypothetical protein
MKRLVTKFFHADPDSHGTAQQSNPKKGTLSNPPFFLFGPFFIPSHQQKSAKIEDEHRNDYIRYHHINPLVVSVIDMLKVGNCYAFRCFW